MLLDDQNKTSKSEQKNTRQVENLLLLRRLKTVAFLGILTALLHNNLFSDKSNQIDSLIYFHHKEREIPPSICRNDPKYSQVFKISCLATRRQRC